MINWRRWRARIVWLSAIALQVRNLGESGHGSLSLARAAAMASRTTSIRIHPGPVSSLSLLSTELSYAKAHSRQSRSADGKFIFGVLSLSRFCQHGTRRRAHRRLGAYTRCRSCARPFARVTGTRYLRRETGGFRSFDNAIRVFNRTFAEKSGAGP